MSTMVVPAWADSPSVATPRSAPEGVTYPPAPVSGIVTVPPREEKADFLELYRTQFAYVWKTARRLGVRPTDVDDVVQETFLTAHKLLDGYESRGSDRAWLFSILFGIVQRQRRSRWRWSALFDSGKTNLDEVAAPPSSGPETSAETNETARLLDQILEGLDPERRAVLILADIEDRQVNEIAEILSINRNTAASRLRAARAHVEAAIARHRACDGWRYK